MKLLIAVEREKAVCPRTNVFVLWMTFADGFDKWSRISLN